MTVSIFTWRGVDDTTRVDHAALTINDTGMAGHGTSITCGYATSWQLDVGPGWVTRQLRIAVQGVGWFRSLVLLRSTGGVWSSEVSFSGQADLPAPGLAAPSSVDGAIDCDVGLCPVTNTMPIRRLGLLDHDVPETSLAMAWVEVPSLRVVRSDQIYASSPARSSRTVRYASADRSFQAELTVDDVGVVIDYPALARRIALWD
jgi:hypothetical protein